MSYLMRLRDLRLCSSQIGRAASVLVLIALMSLWAVAPAWGQCRTYTSDADFDEGLLVNVIHGAPGSNHLQLDTTTTPFPFVNIACSNRGTIVRIDVNTGNILGEYRTAPDGRGKNPSRTTVDLQGNVWVANRDEYDGGKGSVVRIGLVIGGTRVDADGTPNPNGQYLKPPFLYSTCSDRDGDGLIKTSRALGNILPWTNPGGIDNNGGVSSAEDECIINYTRVAGTGTRTVAIDANNDVWVGGCGDLDHEKLDGVTGQPIPGTQFNLGCGGYGGLVDGNGILWSARCGANLLRYNPASATGVCLNTSHGDYGLAVDPATGHIWHVNHPGNRIAELAPDGTLLHAYNHGDYYAQGVAVDGSGNVWVAHSLYRTTVGHLRTDGTLVGVIPLPGGNGPTGVAVDANGKIWVANYNSHNAMRIDPNAGPIGGGGFPVGAVDMTVDLNAAGGPAAYPYNYSDMTGFVAIGSTAPHGTWTVSYDGLAPATNWGMVCWNAEACDEQPAGAEIVARARSSEDGINWSDWEIVTNCADLTVPDGRYLQVEMKLIPNDDGESPILCDVTICTGVQPVVFDIKPQSCPNPLNVKGDRWDEGTYSKPEPGITSEDVSAPDDVSDRAAVLPVAILGTADFDVAEIDPATVELQGVPPIRSSWEDVATPVDDTDWCACTTRGPDGYRDLTLKFDHAAIVAALGEVHDGDIIPLTITGELFDGTHIEGTDCVIIRGDRQVAEGASAAIGAGGVISLSNHPNPFNATTEISFTLPIAGRVTLGIYNITGQKVATIVDEFMEAGSYRVAWDGADVASGVYLYRLQVGESAVTKKMTLLK